MVWIDFGLREISVRNGLNFSRPSVGALPKTLCAMCFNFKVVSANPRDRQPAPLRPTGRACQTPFPARFTYPTQRRRIRQTICCKSRRRNAANLRCGKVKCGAARNGCSNGANCARVSGAFRTPRRHLYAALAVAPAWHAAAQSVPPRAAYAKGAHSDEHPAHQPHLRHGGPDRPETPARDRGHEERAHPKLLKRRDLAWNCAKGMCADDRLHARSVMEA